MEDISMRGAVVRIEMKFIAAVFCIDRWLSFCNTYISHVHSAIDHLLDRRFVNSIGYPLGADIPHQL